MIPSHMLTSPLAESEYKDDTEELAGHLNAPMQRSSQPYTNWLSIIERNAYKIYKQDYKRIFIAAVERLKVCQLCIVMIAASVNFTVCCRCYTEHWN